MSEQTDLVAEIGTDKLENQENTNVSEEYAYLDRGGFSSEKFKIELRGLPKFYGIAVQGTPFEPMCCVLLDKGTEKYAAGLMDIHNNYSELKKLMNNKLSLNTSKIKRPKNGSHWLYACFQNDEERTKAIAALNGYSWKGKTLIAEAAKPAPDPLVRKRKQDEEGSQNKKKKEDDNKSQEERLKDAVTPYWNIPYEEQVKLKEKEIKNLLMKFDNEVWKIHKEKRNEIESNRKIYNSLSFELKPIQKSPVTEGYRNKCEFTVGIDEESQKPTVGFRLGSYVTGTVGVAPVGSLNHISEKMKKSVLIFQDFVRQSDMSPFSPADYSGYWRYLTVRESKHSGDLMLIIAMHPQDLSTEQLEELKKKLIDHFSSEESVACDIKSVYFELLTKSASAMFAYAHTDDFYAIMRKRIASLMRGGRGSTNVILRVLSDKPDCPMLRHWVLTHVYVPSAPVYNGRRVGEDGSKPSHLMGSTHIIDTILGRQFRISPEAFFQINTAGADILYQSAIDMSRVDSGATVVDICCGTGTIGLCFAKHCNKVLGLELVAEAVKDAKANADLNDIGNCEFFTGKAEDVLPSVLARVTGDDVIAIVDPPRAGLHMRAVTQLRNTRKVKRLVYISCSPASAIKNFVDLSRPSSKTLRGAPFVPVTAVPVDMFPYTKHVELAILFEREQCNEEVSEVKSEQDAEANGASEEQATTDIASSKEEKEERGGGKEESVEDNDLSTNDDVLQN